MAYHIYKIKVTEEQNTKLNKNPKKQKGKSM